MAELRECKMYLNNRHVGVAGLVAALSLVLGSSAFADDVDKPEPAAVNAPDLDVKQTQVAEKFRELKAVLLRMAELTAASDPRRATLLRQAVAQANDRGVDGQLESLIELLKQEQLSKAVKGQGEVKQDLDAILELLLSEDHGRRVQSEKERIRNYIKELNKLIKEQGILKAETSDTRASEKKLAEDQNKLSDKTGKLARKIDETEGGKPNSGEKPSAGDPKKQEKDNPDKDGKPTEGKDSKGQPSPGKGEKAPGGGGEAPPQGDSEGEPQSAPPPPANPAQQRLEQAQKRMQEAEKKLQEAKREDAQEKQDEAIRELEQAKAELEEILRQLREEEAGRMLAALEQRFRKMLALQIDVLDGTKRLDHLPEADRDRDDEIESGRLSRKESEIVAEADKAMAILAEDGTAVAFPEAISEMRDDMEQVVVRLAQFKVNTMTQGIEEDIIAALEELIAALKQAQQDLKNKPQSGGGGGGQQGDPPLVDDLAELKMIRALQMRVNRRTQRYGELIKTDQAEQPELLKALERLAEREERIHRVTRDIVAERNK
jgi:hypothetical protein